MKAPFRRPDPWLWILCFRSGSGRWSTRIRVALLTFGGGDAKASGVCDGRLLRIKQGYGEDSRFPMSLVGGPLERDVLRLLGKRIGFPLSPNSSSSAKVWSNSWHGLLFCDSTHGKRISRSPRVRDGQLLPTYVQEMRHGEEACIPHTRERACRFRYLTLVVFASHCVCVCVCSLPRTWTGDTLAQALRAKGVCVQVRIA